MQWKHRTSRMLSLRFGPLTDAVHARVRDICNAEVALPEALVKATTWDEVLRICEAALTSAATPSTSAPAPPAPHPPRHSSQAR
jgi:hypothetical protein